MEKAIISKKQVMCLNRADLGELHEQVKWHQNKLLAAFSHL